jgi:amidase
MENPKLHKYSETWLVESTVEDQQEKMESGELTSKELVLMYMNRIGKFDSAGLFINSILEINPDALSIAESLDIERQEKGPRSPMHGIPVVIKDNIDTGDRMHTSAGSLAIANSYAQQDSFVAYKLREAGAVILGKTNMTEWANFMAQDMKNGYSSRGGQVLNPYGPGVFDVGGSSSGSGAAIASNFATVAVGTETSGSILSPSCQNSLVGVKPTVGLVSRKGIIPITHTQDTAGPMARTVKDAAYLLDALWGMDKNDTATKKIPSTTGSFAKSLNVNNLEGTRVGVPRVGFYEHLDEERKGLMETAIEKLKELGATIVDSVEITSAKRNWSYEVLTYEFKSGLNAYLSQLSPSIQVRSLVDVIQFNENNKEEALKYGQSVLLESDETSGTLTEKAYIEALERQTFLAQDQGIDQVLKRYDLDALLFPHYWGSTISAIAQYPSVTVPAGYTKENEPFNITFTSTAFSEKELLGYAYAYEQSTKHRKAPILEMSNIF